MVCINGLLVCFFGFVDYVIVIVELSDVGLYFGGGFCFENEFGVLDNLLMKGN